MNYTVNEGAGEVLVNVSVLDGSIVNSDTEIEVLLTPREGTGVGELGPATIRLLVCLFVFFVCLFY